MKLAVVVISRVMLAVFLVSAGFSLVQILAVIDRGVWHTGFGSWYFNSVYELPIFKSRGATYIALTIANWLFISLIVAGISLFLSRFLFFVSERMR